MKPEKNILEQNLIKSPKPEVPESFFANFYANLLDKIDSETLVDNLVKSEKPKLDKDYFSNFANKIASQAQDINEVPNILDQLKKSTQPAIPEGYFEDFAENKLEQLKENKETKVISLVWVRRIAAVAAVLAALLFFYDWNETPTQIAEQPVVSEQEIESEFEIESEQELPSDTYLTYLDEYDLMNYLAEEGISMDNDDASDLDDIDIYEISDEYLEELYYELN
ncbi:hypothetical protein [Crocinitomix catalasitica]|uniref:hypothetical protein n=1 Tax=Crocinitomix catalasitica TaxID=184607 RepID=UPI0004899CC3|nr:hypothetical protein [Crocinitomix catalasitica]